MKTLTPTTGIVIPAQTADALWVTNILITSPAPNRPISAQIRVAPYNTANGVIYGNLSKNLNIPDVAAQYTNFPSVQPALNGMLTAIQDMVTGTKLF